MRLPVAATDWTSDWRSQGEKCPLSPSDWGVGKAALVLRLNTPSNASCKSVDTSARERLWASLQGCSTISHPMT